LKNASPAPANGPPEAASSSAPATVDQFPKAEVPAPAAYAEFGLSPTGDREGEQLLLTLLELADPAFRSPVAMRVFAASLGSTPAELRVEVAAVLTPWLKRQGFSNSAARKRALTVAFAKPKLTIVALLTRRSSGSVFDALMAATRDAGVLQ
jgi:hypothetical protein